MELVRLTLPGTDEVRITGADTVDHLIAVGFEIDDEWFGTDDDPDGAALDQHPDPVADIGDTDLDADLDGDDDPED